jgi:Trp operon repressor
MKQLTEEQLLANWEKLLQLVKDTFEGERQEKLLEMYKW